MSHSPNEERRVYEVEKEQRLSRPSAQRRNMEGQILTLLSILSLIRR
jgi:hypothetical protein